MDLKVDTGSHGPTNRFSATDQSEIFNCSLGNTLILDHELISGEKNERSQAQQNGPEAIYFSYNPGVRAHMPVWEQTLWTASGKRSPGTTYVRSGVSKEYHVS